MNKKHTFRSKWFLMPTDVEHDLKNNYKNAKSFYDLQLYSYGYVIEFKTQEDLLSFKLKYGNKEVLSKN